jgi:hypothetical protein
MFVDKPIMDKMAFALFYFQEKNYIWQRFQNEFIYKNISLISSVGRVTVS